MSHILVTGGNGFIGSHLVDKLVESGEHSVTVFDLYPRPFDSLPDSVTFIQGDLRDSSLLRRTIIDQGIEVIYHVAWSTIHETALKNPVADIESNVIPTVHLLDICCEVGIKRLIYISSGGTVYGLPEHNLVTENHPTFPINAYGVTKLMVEKYLHMYHYLYGLEYCIFRPSVPYGPRQNPRRRQGAVAVFIYHALHNEPITIWGDGEIIRDYFYVEDMIEAFVKALSPNLSPASVFNLAGAKGYTLNQLVREIETALNIDIDVIYEPGRKFDVPKMRLDIDSAIKTLNWRPQTPLSLGIQRTARWITEWID